MVVFGDGFRGWSRMPISVDNHGIGSGMGNNSEITWISPSRLEGLAKWCQGEKGNLEVL